MRLNEPQQEIGDGRPQKFGGALIGIGILAVTATTASAAVVCNDDGDCWRTKNSTPILQPLAFTSMLTIGNGDRMKSIGGASMKVVVIGTRVFGSDSRHFKELMTKSSPGRAPGFFVLAMKCKTLSSKPATAVKR